MLDAIFYKTEKGRDELATRRHKLGMRHRQALILLDGDSRASELVKVLGDVATATRIVEELQAGGFISTTKPAGSPITVIPPETVAAVVAAAAEPVAPAIKPAPPVAEEVKPRAAAVPPAASTPIQVAVAPVSPANGDRPESSIDRVKIESARIIMLDTTDRCLGLMGADLKQRIAAAQDAGSLRTIIPRWHMALRESRRGHDDAQRYLDTVIAALDS